jgi:hypothetical protein
MKILEESAVALAKEGVKIAVAARRAKEGDETVRLVKEAGSVAFLIFSDNENELGEDEVAF